MAKVDTASGADVVDVTDAARVIDVLIAIDAETILQNYPGATDSNNPVAIANNLVYMITDAANVVSGQGGGELDLAANVFDTIDWRETTLSLNGEYCAILYSFTAEGGGGDISAPTPVIATVHTPLPNPQNPLSPTTQTVQNYYWTCQVLAQGRMTYNFCFMILDNNGNKLGYYIWDPYITISN